MYVHELTQVNLGHSITKAIKMEMKLELNKDTENKSKPN